jgi:hypothetical protein
MRYYRGCYPHRSWVYYRACRERIVDVARRHGCRVKVMEGSRALQFARRPVHADPPMRHHHLPGGLVFVRLHIHVASRNHYFVFVCYSLQVEVTRPGFDTIFV